MSRSQIFRQGKEAHSHEECARFKQGRYRRQQFRTEVNSSNARGQDQTIGEVPGVQLGLRLEGE